MTFEVPEHVRPLRDAVYEFMVELVEPRETELDAGDPDADAIMAELKPDELYLPYPSLHQDHIAVYEAGMRSCRVSMSLDHWFPPSVYVYDIAVYDVNLYPTDLRWNVFEALTEEQITAKEAACQAYQSEIPTDVHPINSVRQIAGALGQVRLVPYAEQYALVRTVRR